MAAFGLVLAGCGDDESTSAPSASSSGPVAVVTGFYPLAEAASRVGGDRVAVANLTPPGAEPHDIELTSRQVDSIEDATLVLYLGEGFQPAVEEVAARSGGIAVDLLDGQDLLDGTGHGHDEAEAEAGHEGEGDGADAHVWLDPSRMEGIVERVRDALIEADPDGADAYRANADRYRAELAELDRDFATGLADCERDAIVTSHAAFGYLADRYGLTQDALAGLSPESEPDPQRLAELADEVRAEGVTTIFYESLVAPDLAETLAREAGVGTAVLDPIEGLTDDQVAAGATYESVMRENLVALRSALGCR
ncbi:MAG: metal ABC transporter solute-binding protein, Zn/Mn family [Acidimicrobiia bacterium]